MREEEVNGTAAQGGCAHSGCRCQGSMEKDGKKYCSDHCQRAGNESPCTCGHPDCGK